MFRNYIPILPLVVALFFALSCDPTNKEPVPTDTLTVSPTSLDFEAEDTATKLAYLTTEKDWTATPSAGWIHLEKTSGTGKATLAVSVDANQGEDRTGSITVKGSNTVTIAVSQTGRNILDAFETTYQLLIYTFADSNGDGVGDFKGIQNKLDYLDGLGVEAIWLSPAQKTSSYHGYDVDDYFALNPLFGTEQDFKNLINAAHAKGIKIYMDYVLNHTGKHNEWFTTAVSSASNAYSDYFVLSQDPEADLKAGKLDNFGGQTSYSDMGGWTQITGGDAGYKGRLHFKVDMNDKTVTVTKTSEAAQSPNNTNPAMWLWYGSVTSHVGMYTTGDKVYEITLDFDSDWGFLVCSKTDWSGGSKFGSQNTSSIEFGKPFPLYSNSNNDVVKNITFGGFTTNYFGAFGSWMPDLNYGPYTSCENSPAFKATVESAKKWIDMGVDGFRLDAVVWVYQRKHDASIRFLEQWYKAVNKVYKDAGHSDNIFMVGEAWENHSTERQYYKGLPSNFEFDYGGMLSNVLKSGNASSYVSTVSRYITEHEKQRSDAVTSLFLTNHDQNRWAEWVDKSLPLQKQAAAMLLTSPGKPFIYMGEELGYTGVKTGDSDAPRRMPMAWDANLSNLAKFGLDDSHKYDNTDYSIVEGSVSVAVQEADPQSLLNVYKTWGRLRKAYPVLAKGTMTDAKLGGGNSVAAWYMNDGNQKLLVIHNVATSEKSVKVPGDLSKQVALLGTATLDHDTLTLSGNSSVVFKQ